MVQLIRSDLDFILDQILISEAHAKGADLTTLLPNIELPWGLRTVDGSENNLLPGQSEFGAADNPFPRSLEANWVNEIDDAMLFGPPGTPAIPGVTLLINNDYQVQLPNNNPDLRAIQPGDVVDADPRIISNLIADQTVNNPAAVQAALKFAGIEGPEATAAIAQIIGHRDALKAAEDAAGGATTAVAQAEQNLADAQAALDAAIAANATVAAAIGAYTAAVASAGNLAASSTSVDTTTSDLVVALGDLTVDPGDAATLTAAQSATDALLANLNAVLAELDVADANVAAVIDDADVAAVQNFATAVGVVQSVLASIDLVDNGSPTVDLLDTLNAAIAELAANGFPQLGADLVVQLQASLDATIAIDTDITAALSARDGAQSALDTANDALAAVQPAIDAAQALLDADYEEFGLDVTESGSFVIPNVAPDEGLSAPFNSWMTLFGQFFDHGLDLVAKGGYGSVYIPLQEDDPLYVEGGATNFMVVTRATLEEVTHAGDDGILGTVDDFTTMEPTNLTTPWVDQNQTYTSHPSHQVFHREYVLRDVQIPDPQNEGQFITVTAPRATGHLLDGAGGGLANWAEVKAQARDLLGIELDDQDVLNVPLLATDQYGNFIPDPATGYPQIVLDADQVGGALDPDGNGLASGTPGAPIDASFAVRTGHAFLDDIAHDAAPGGKLADSDSALGIDLVANPNFDADFVGPQSHLLESTAFVVANPQFDNGQAVSAVNPAFLSRSAVYDNELLDRHFVTGDGRGNENIGLTTVHHVFHSEHNRLVEQIQHIVIKEGDAVFLSEWLEGGVVPATFVFPVPTNFVDEAAYDAAVETAIQSLEWNGERLFQAAKLPTEMQYQHLVFEEFARKVQPFVNVFNDYNAQLDGAIFAEFAHTVYRFGHSMLNETVDLFDKDTGVVTEVGLIEAFLNPVGFHHQVKSDGKLAGVPGVDIDAFDADAAAGMIAQGMTRQRGNAIDEHVTDALRNNLLGLPLDLAAINIGRARENGVPSLNQARADFFAGTNDSQLKPYESWVDFALNLKSPASVINFIAAYGKHESITLVDTLAEKLSVITVFETQKHFA